MHELTFDRWSSGIWYYYVLVRNWEDAENGPLIDNLLRFVGPGYLEELTKWPFEMVVPTNGRSLRTY